MTNHRRILTEAIEKLSFSGNALVVSASGGVPTALYGNAVTLPGTLPSQAVLKGVTVKAKSSNVADILVNGFALGAGESIPIDIDNLSKVLVTGTAGDIFYYLGS